MDPTQIEGYGADADPSARPGIPMERDPAPWPHAKVPAEQATPSSVFSFHPAGPLPPVRGTAQPPRGLSGALRNLAYRRPGHKSSHWLLLMVADRVDVLEHRLGKLAAPAAVLVGLGLFMRWARR